MLEEHSQAKYQIKSFLVVYNLAVDLFNYLDTFLVAR